MGLRLYSTTTSRIVLSLFLTSFFICGCQSTHRPPAVRYEPRPRKPVPPPVVQQLEDTPDPQRSVIGKSVEGRPIECLSYGNGDEVVLILATIHGNEPAGTDLVHWLGQALVEEPSLLAGRQVLIVPVANPDGMAHGTRHNVHGVDLNRNFPASNFSATRRHGDQALSEPESRALYELIGTCEPDRVISIHQPLACIDYDGPAGALADVMANKCGLPVKRLGGRPGSLGSCVGANRNIPIVTVELPQEASDLCPRIRWRVYGRMLLSAVTYPSPVVLGK